VSTTEPALVVFPQPSAASRSSVVKKVALNFIIFSEQEAEARP